MKEKCRLKFLANIPISVWSTNDVEMLVFTCQNECDHHHYPAVAVRKALMGNA